MKVCLNCNALNELTAAACKACRMPNKFAPTAAEPPQQQLPATITCRNCGHDTQGQERCPGCRFPVGPTVQTSARRAHATPGLHFSAQWINNF